MTSTTRIALTEVFLVELLKDFSLRGPRVIAELAEKSPEKYLALIAKVGAPQKGDPALATLDQVFEVAVLPMVEARKALPNPYPGAPVWRDAGGRPCERARRH